MCDVYEIDDVMYCYTQEELEQFSKEEIDELQKYKIKLKVADVKRPPIFKQDQNIYNDELTNCKLITSKKTEYYTHLSTAINKILPGHNELDYKVYKNCCNCASILFYSNKKRCNAAVITKYLASVTKTIFNVKKYLPDFVVRLYLDSTLYDLFETCMTGLNFYLFENLFQYDNVEIYTIKCKTSETFDLGITRTYRTLVLKDGTVNVRIIRDADGILSKVDAHNIRIFTKSNKLFYLPPLHIDFPISHNPLRFVIIKRYPNQPIKMYSRWLNDYISFNIMDDKGDIVPDNFYNNNYIAYNLLCGLYASKIKFTNDYYDDCAMLVKNVIDKTGAYFGFDEMLLLELHKHILSFPKNSENIGDYTIFDSYVFSPINNMKNYVVKLTKGDVDQCILTDKYITIPKSYNENISDEDLESNYVPDSTNAFKLNQDECILLNYIDDNILINDENVIDIQIQYSPPLLMEPTSLLQILNIPYAGKIKDITN
jgi:hypothetical protein